MSKFDKSGAAVLGISPDSPSAQKSFEQKQALKIPLLSDEDKQVATAWGCYGEKKMYGRTVKGIIRTTYLVDPNGKVAHVWSPVRVDGHAEKVLQTLLELKD